MEIYDNCVVALTWVLQDTLGEELDVLDEPVEFLLGGKDLLPAIEAALHPTETDCLYYLHDSNKQIHCANTFEEHKQNIAEYLQ